jgi:uncharacterized protein
MVRSPILALKVKSIAMLISNRTIRLSVCFAALIGAASAHAFEVTEKSVDSAPAAALPALPTNPAPLSTDLGLSRSMRSGWQSFVDSYRSGDKKAARAHLEPAAANGDILAQWKLGRMYADGDGGPVDHYKAFQLFSRIANDRADESPDSPQVSIVSNAFVALGHYWASGIPKSPVTANQLEAAKAFNHAAQLFAHPEAQYQLARMMLDGSAGKQEPRLALRWLNLAAAKGHVQAQAVLGRMLFLGESTQRQTRKGLMWLEVAREGANASKDGWVLDTHQKAFDAASEEERLTARRQAQRFLKSAERN